MTAVRRGHARWWIAALVTGTLWVAAMYLIGWGGFIVQRIITPRVLGVSQRAAEVSARTMLVEIRQATAAFRGDMGAWPVDLVDLLRPTAPERVLVVKSGRGEVRASNIAEEARYRGPYLVGRGGVLLDELPVCPLNGRNDAATWAYEGAGAPAAEVGNLSLGVPGNDSSGYAYADW